KSIKQNLRLRHIHQLHNDIPDSRSSSAIYLDLLDAMSTVLEHTFSIAQALQGCNLQSLTGQFRNLRSFTKSNWITTGQLPGAANELTTQELDEYPEMDSIQVSLW